MKQSRVLVFRLLCAAACLAQAGFGQDVINADFDNDDGGVALVGSAQIEDDGCGNKVLILTRNVGSQAGYGWFPDSFNLAADRVEIEFDLFIGAADTLTPADGVSVIFQFDEDLSATGDPGGGMGVGHFRTTQGADRPYVSVGFDIWDNGAALDPRTPCDGVHGPDGVSSCHVEVDQNIDPEEVRSQTTNVDEGFECPDYISSAAVYANGSSGTLVGAGCDQGDLIHVTIIFDNHLMLVKMGGGLASSGTPFPEQTVISYATADFPVDPVTQEVPPTNIGFTASTGARIAWQWVDNIVVRTGTSLVSFEPEPPLTAGGMNCGGGAVDATAEVGASFRADVAYGLELSRSGDPETGMTITMNRLGRIAGGADYTNVNANPLDLSKIPGAGTAVAQFLRDHAWSTKAVEYKAGVQPGKYEVSLYWAENYGGAIDAVGRGTKLYDVYLSGEMVLCNWSAAAAAGSATTSGDPRGPCVATLNKAVRRTFTVNVPASDDPSVGFLDILVDDLGGGNPPENAALDAFSFKRLGNADAAGPGGDVECVVPPEAPAPTAVVISEDFDEDEGKFPDSMVLNKITTSTGNFNPTVVDGRLRLAQEGSAADRTYVGITANFKQCVNVLDSALVAEFDLFLSWPDGMDPADGGAFYVIQGTDTSARGDIGGWLAIPTNAYGFAVEFDTYRWCCFNAGNDDVSGMSDTAAPYPHVAINNLSTDSSMAMVDYDPTLKPVANGGAGWLDFRDPGGVHVTVTYNAGHVEVVCEGIDEEGGAFGPTTVAAADVTPIWLPQAVVGFSGATGGLTLTMEYDNVEISAAQCREPTAEEDPAAAAIASARTLWQTEKQLYINCGGPPLFCRNPVQFPAPQATGDTGPGDSVTWVGDLATGAGPYAGEFFSLTALNSAMSTAGLNVRGTDMGLWDARGTSAGVDDADSVFHNQRYSPVEYGIPVPHQGPWELTLYFANSQSAAADTARCGFHVEIEGDRKGDFTHCTHSGKLTSGTLLQSRWVPKTAPPFDEIFDPVDAADQLYSPDACNFAACGPVPGCTAETDSGADQIADNLECGNAAAVAIRYQVTVADGVLNIALTPPVADDGEPLPPSMDPYISGITLWPAGSIAQENCNNGNVDDDGDQLADCDDPDCASAPNCQGGKLFHRGDPNNDGSINITDGIYILNFLFLGGPKPTCLESANPNDDASVNITDGIYVLNFLFLGGPPPTVPGPTSSPCGPDPVGAGKTDLGCEVYTKC